MPTCLPVGYIDVRRFDVSAIRWAYQSSAVRALARLCKNLAGGGPIDAYKYREKHIKCTGYCRRASCRQLLISCCQPRAEVNQSNLHIRTLTYANTYANTYAARHTSKYLRGAYANYIFLRHTGCYYKRRYCSNYLSVETRSSGSQLIF